MLYRNTITGLEFMTDCVICAPNVERVDNTPHKQTPPAIKPEEPTPKEEKPRKRTRRVKK